MAPISPESYGAQGSDSRAVCGHSANLDANPLAEAPNRAIVFQGPFIMSELIRMI